MKNATATAAGAVCALAGLSGRARSVRSVSDSIERYDPAHAWNGYTLDLYERRTPVLFDMNGRLFHTWPQVRAAAGVRLLPDGRLLAIGSDNVVREYDWDGRERWSYRNDPAED